MIKLTVFALSSLVFVNCLYAHSLSKSCSEERARAPVNELTDDVDSVMCKLASRGYPIVVGGRHGPKYSIEQKSDNQFAIEINVRFYQNGRSPNRDFHAYVNSCLIGFEPFLRGPNGEILSIRTVNKSQPDPVNIEILAEGARSHSEGYSQDIDCPTVLHEVLHLLGLEDEYPEGMVGFVLDKDSGQFSYVEDNADVLAYDCRATTFPQSIMYDHYEAIAAIKPPKPNEPVRSLLMPAHFRVIAYPLCEGENRGYRECTEEAYQSSVTRECSLKAKECQSNSDWLH